jgi:hypothetical protein
VVVARITSAEAVCSTRRCSQESRTLLFLFTTLAQIVRRCTEEISATDSLLPAPYGTSFGHILNTENISRYNIIVTVMHEIMATQCADCAQHGLVACSINTGGI